MGRRLAGYVWLVDPEDGRPVGFGPADDVPGWAADLITDPAAWQDGAAGSEASSPAAEPAEPPKGNASREAWATYAEGVGLSVPNDATRNDIRDLVKAAGDG